jgi:glycosyltransferase involved in cell wall biosynthesis
MLNILPPSPPSKSGWPWTDESKPLPPFQPDGSLWPRISIVTPSLNQGQFIEETIRSILLQNYPNLEYIIIDGGSTDNTIEIIKKYEPWIAFWLSEPDLGQSDAINKGFKRCTGDLANWICSDDMLCKNALLSLAEHFLKTTNALFIGKGFRIDKNSKIINEISPADIENISNLLDIKNFWRKSDSIMQQSCFYPLKAVVNSGYLNEKNHYSMDYELWGRILMTDIRVVRFNSDVGMFRWYQGQKTSNFNRATNSLVKTALCLILEKKDFSFVRKISLIIKVVNYYVSYYYHFTRSAIGLKRRLNSLQNVSPDNLYN